MWVICIYLEAHHSEGKGNSWVCYRSNGKIYYDVDASFAGFPSNNVCDCFQRKFFGANNFLNGNHAASNCNYPN